MEEMWGVGISPGISPAPHNSIHWFPGKLKLCKMKVQQFLAAGAPKIWDQARGCRGESLGALTSQKPPKAEPAEFISTA